MHRKGTRKGQHKMGNSSQDTDRSNATRTRIAFSGRSEFALAAVEEEHYKPPITRLSLFCHTATGAHLQDVRHSVRLRGLWSLRQRHPHHGILHHHALLPLGLLPDRSKQKCEKVGECVRHDDLQHRQPLIMQDSQK